MSSLNAELLKPSVNFWLNEAPIAARFVLAEYGQVMQELANPQGLLSQNSSGLNCILIRFEDLVFVYTLQRNNLNMNDVQQILLDRTTEFVAYVKSASAHSRVEYLIAVAPATPLLSEVEAWREATVSAMRQLMSLEQSKKITVLDLSARLAIYELNQYFDEYQALEAHIPYTTGAFNAIGTEL